jgi:hypothetical protein
MLSPRSAVLAPAFAGAGSVLPQAPIRKGCEVPW